MVQMKKLISMFVTINTIVFNLRKRPRRAASRKRLRNSGKSFENSDGKAVPSKSFKTLDSKCREKCAANFAGEPQNLLFEGILSHGIFCREKYSRFGYSTNSSNQTSLEI